MVPFHPARAELFAVISIAINTKVIVIIFFVFSSCDLQLSWTPPLSGDVKFYIHLTFRTIGSTIAYLIDFQREYLNKKRHALDNLPWPKVDCPYFHPFFFKFPRKKPILSKSTVLRTIELFKKSPLTYGD